MNDWISAALNFDQLIFHHSAFLAHRVPKKKRKERKSADNRWRKISTAAHARCFPRRVCVCGGVIFMRLTRGNTHTHSRRRKNWGLVRKNALELTHAPRFLVQRYLISCWLVLGWLDHSSIFGWLGWYYTFWSTGRGTDMISLIFFYCLEKHTRIFIKVAKVCKFAVCQVLILKFSNKLKPLAPKNSNSPQNEDWSILALWPAGKTTEVTVRRWPFSTTMWGARIGTYSNTQPGRTNVCHISAELFGHGKLGPWLAGWLAGCSG